MFSKRGFTLVEVVAAIAVLALGLVVVLRLLPEGVRSARDVERSTRGVLLAQYKVDEIRSQILGGNPGFDKPGGYGETGEVFPDDPDYYYTVTDDEASGIKELGVTVWFDEDGDGIQDEDERPIQLDTKIANRG
ncbi:MAG: prepilin-type N-terminal cleavage/methylation domain-containing protein [Candidatus Omnitrophica bacterium]|nr:prepilin-type N-terminal cleavage/methylation domain-containing protein [Candidatus Omnitrophota bacterium]MBU1128195.1 prepilin-type N-terminal cleavage/methylation domain-containing protein [Candidatus Omnitrophota bacterium]MBU1852062.1 prepilin-type N-terminal cleavage/methylation domain-containing protein [Candidatus Omnitrophota bacterium]